jgi:aminoglycoside/choline kinase family phosphotransferase
MLDDDGAMLDRIRRALEARFGPEVAAACEADKMGGHASLRVYWRLHLPTGESSPDHTPGVGESTLVAMVLASPASAFESAEGPDDEECPEVLPFVDVQRYLASLDLPVPALEHVDREAGVLLLEDLGDQTFEDAYLELASDSGASSVETASSVLGLYRHAIDLLVETQRSFVQSREIYGESLRERCIGWRRAFDRETLRWELDHYLEWGVGARRSEKLLETHREAFDEEFDALVDALLDVPKTVALRDYQSRNLMYRPSEARRFDWVLIDFQDALVGPVVYDLVALLRDSYVELAPERVGELVDYYVEAGRDVGLTWCEDREAIRRAFHLQTIQRKLKDAGRFVYLDREKGNPDFLEYYEPSIRYVDVALEQLPGWDELRDLLHRVEAPEA